MAHTKSFAALALGLLAAGAMLIHCAPETSTGGDPDAAVCDKATGTNCPCDPATYKPSDCYEGPKGTNGKGICKAGKKTCTNGLITACVGQVLPKTEVCNLADDDCDGTADNLAEFANVKPVAFCNSPACSPTWTDAGIECYSADKKGICAAGRKACAPSLTGGQPNGCEAFPGIRPAPEVCNGVDDDCNGLIDDDCQN